MVSLELKIARFLRFGVFLSGGVMVMGHFLRGAATPAEEFDRFRVYQGIPLSLELSQAWDRGQWGLLFSYAGLFLLVSLPVIRVFLTSILFFKMKERPMAAIAFFVLIALGCSFLLGTIEI